MCLRGFGNGRTKQIAVAGATGSGDEPRLAGDKEDVVDVRRDLLEVDDIFASNAGADAQPVASFASAYQAVAIDDQVEESVGVVLLEIRKDLGGFFDLIINCHGLVRAGKGDRKSTR